MEKLWFCKSCASGRCWLSVTLLLCCLSGFLRLACVKSSSCVGDGLWQQWLPDAGRCSCSYVSGWHTGFCTRLPIWRSLTPASSSSGLLAEHDGDDQSYKEHEADASKGSPDENLTVQIQNVLTACSCRKEGERGKRKGPPPSCGDVQLWQSHREVLQHRRLVVNVCEERASTEHRGRGGDQACPQVTSPAVGCCCGHCAGELREER